MGKLSLGRQRWLRSLNRGGPLTEVSFPIFFLQLFRDFDYWPLNGGWPLNGRGSTVYE